MECPFCKGSMEQGFLQSGSIITWVRKPHKFSLLPQKGEVRLGRDIINAPALPAHICKSCKKVVVSYEMSNYKER